MRVQKKEDGFTLIEALISIVILVVGLLAISQIFVMAMSSNAVANRATGAAAAAAQQMDNLKVIPYMDARMAPGGGNVSLSDPTYVGTDFANYNSDVDMPGVGRVHVRWRIVAIDANLRYIQVRADVPGFLSALNTAQLTTFRSCTARVVGCP